MASLDQSIIDLAFLDGIMEWLKAHHGYWLSIEYDHIAIWKRDNQTMVSDQVELFDNANQLLEWIRTCA